MTEREQLIKRISAAMAKAEPNIGATRAMIEAAIAEFEKDCVAQIKIDAIGQELYIPQKYGDSK